MTVEAWTFLFVTLSFLIYTYIGWRSRIRDSEGFFVAERGVPAIANGAATAADYMSAATFISSAGLISFLGYDGFIYIVSIGGFVLLALLIAPYLRKFGQYTVPDFIATRYYSKAARIIAVGISIIICVTYVAGQMRGVGIVFSRFLQVPISAGVVIGMAIVGFFAILGGMKGITWTQVAQYVVLLTAYLIPACAIAWILTGDPIPQLAFVFGDITDKLNAITLDLGFHNYTQPFVNKSELDILFITISLCLGCAGLPHVIVRFYTVPSPRAARYSVGWAVLFIALLLTTVPTVAEFSRYNLITSLHDKTPTEIHALDWAVKWENTGLLGFDDKNQNGRIELTPNQDSNEISIDRDIVFLSTPEVAQLAPWTIALVAAGGLAASLSTAAGLLLVISSSIAHDIYYRLIDPEASEEKRVMLGRIMVCVAIAIAGYFGINPPGFVGEIITMSIGFAAASFFPVLLLGIFDKRTNKEGAIAGMLVSFIFTAVYIIGEQFLGMSPWCFGITSQGIGAMGAILNFIVTLSVSRLTPPPPLDVQQLVDDLRSPEDAPFALMDIGEEQLD
ncbi:sodium:solute symporter family protein [Spirulina sp. 06S082]|uniref:sodium:solute symporter family protein n=1 Tax=Spirulina sp. 06S082 TaxID=3110248 RepID=UPI002B1FAB4B|nr:sodium:solute symporter family protein [Spirulina sp. 06S082]MEA5467593.1 sodium:solute symporter family protein [Spirulina sp. 06S082]